MFSFCARFLVGFLHGCCWCRSFFPRFSGQRSSKRKNSIWVYTCITKRMLNFRLKSEHDISRTGKKTLVIGFGCWMTDRMLWYLQLFLCVFACFMEGNHCFHGDSPWQFAFHLELWITQLRNGPKNLKGWPLQTLHPPKPPKKRHEAFVEDSTMLPKAKQRSCKQTQCFLHITVRCMLSCGHQVSSNENPYDIPLYWLVYRDP